MNPGNFLTKHLQSIILAGEVVSAARAGTTGNILVKEYDANHDITKATGTDVPADTTSGYAKGCIFIDTDVGSGTTGRYENVGTNTSCNFDAIASTVPAGSIDTTELADNGVTLAKMDDLAQGSLIVGGAADAPTALDASTDAQILVGDGTDLNSVALSGDVTIANDGTATIGAKAVEDTMISATAGTVLVGTKTDLDVTLLDTSAEGALVIGQGAGETCAAAVISGDATMASSGVLTIDSHAGDVTIATDKKIEFRDTGLYIQSSTDGQLDIIGDTKVQVTSPTVEFEASTSILLDGDVTIDGTHELTTGTGDVNINGDVIIDTDKQIFLRDAGVYLQSSVDGQGDFIADTVVKVTSPTIEFEGSSEVDITGGLIDINAGAGATATAGYAVEITGGTGGDTDSTGGAVTINAGSGGTTNGDGGDITINGGNANGSGTDGDINIGASNTNEVVITPNVIQGTSGYFNVKTLKITVGAVGVADCDFNFVTAANDTEQQIDFGAIIPAKSRVLDIITHTVIGWTGATASTTFKVGSTAGASDYLNLTTEADDTDDINGLATAGVFMLAPSLTAGHVWLSVDPDGTANWSALTTAKWDFFITFTDNTVVG